MKIDKYLTICIGFGCNEDCVSCMLKDMKGNLVPVSFQEYKKIVDENIKTGKYASLILSGAEVTVNKDLLKFVRYARKLKNLKHVRIQTNGLKLSDYEFAKSLVKEGVDEFFISVYGPDKKVHDYITKVRGSLNKTLKGLRNLGRLDCSIITNTVVTTLNYTVLPDIVRKLASFDNIKEMQFWNYWPMAKEDKENLLESFANIRPYLLKAIYLGKETKMPIVVKYFPECLLGNYARALDNSQPDTVIDNSYWDFYNKNEFGRCIYRNKCSFTQCEGLTAAYIQRFGWEEHNLKPISGI